MKKSTPAGYTSHLGVENREQFEFLLPILEQFNHQKDALLELLRTTQDVFGYLPGDALQFISEQLHIPLSKVYGVATFYDMFSIEKQGKNHCVICTDPICAVAGAEEILRMSCEEAGIDQPDQTSPDELYSIKPSACLGLCDQAPAALVNGIAQVDLNASDSERLLHGRSANSRLQINGEPRILTKLIGRIPATDLVAHLSEGRFKALDKALAEMTPEEVIGEVNASKLVGRGGAGFPTGLKWEFTRQAAENHKYVVCNLDESEPGTFKDRVMVEGDPYRIIEGLMISAYAIGAKKGYIFVRGEYPAATAILHKAVDKLYATHYLGKNILRTDFSFDLEIRRGAGAYICGEETALFEAIEGSRGHPPYPTTHGLFGKPTAINNVETLAIVPELILNGGKWYLNWGTKDSIGIKLFCLSGHVNRPGVVEVPFGLTVRELIERYAGGFLGEPQAILIGGASGGFLHPDKLDTPLTNEALKPLDVPIGSGAIMVFNKTVNLWKVLKGFAHFFVNETCGRCVPCRVGTTQMLSILNKIDNQSGTGNDLEKLKEIGTFMKRSSVCGLGMTAANPTLTMLAQIYSQEDAFM